MYVCMSVRLTGCHTNQIIRIEDEKVKYKENSHFMNNQIGFI